MPLQIALQMNALERLNVPFDSTLELARAAAEQGHKLFHYEPQHLRMDMSGGKVKVTATGHPLIYKASAKNPWSLGKEGVRDLGQFDIVLMRQDPPFDLAYIAATHILDHLKGKVKVVNDPTGVRNAPEKLLITHFPELMPPTLITRDRVAIEDFRAKHKDIIIKPLFGYAGHGVFHISPGDDNLPVLVESLASHNHEPWMIQKFLPIAKLGDKRIILLDGEVVGVFVRYPAKGDMRSNMRVGGRPEKVKLSKRDREICGALGPVLCDQGLFLAGIDVIGDYLTEINVTSPTGLIVADKLEEHKGKDRIAERFWKQLLD
jgi:glutathione synthase